MEQRSSLRVAVNADVVVNYRSVGYIRGRIRDISPQGMYVETGRIRMPRNATVEAYLKAGSRGPRLVLNAKVVRVADDGVGLCFESTPDNFASALAALHDPAEG